LLAFNRPALTEQLLERLREVKPSLVLVVADGPRAGHPDDSAACARVRELIKSRIDWPATVRTEYAETNMGLRRRVSSGLNWAFQQVEEAVILEDDCLPHPDFFRFCAELLEYYRHDTRVGVIAGVNFQPSAFTREASYYFSKYPHCWGWATWRRAWRLYDAEAALWPVFKAAGALKHLFPNPLEAGYWTWVFDTVHNGDCDSWAFPWTLTCWGQSMLTVLPVVNLVTNNGDGPDSTHRTENPLLHRPANPMVFPLRHPGNVLADFQADDYTQRHIYGAIEPKGWRAKLRQFLDRPPT
jgi:hypothetical protein